ncbi:MAG: phosphate signaling complex protein PhoU [Phycisphaerae bacterium]|nr:phosphate signaling complex protein PhoU [Phycisphaerae bacterium]
MPVHLLREIEHLKKDILTVGAMAEQSVRKATQAMQDRDEVLAGQIIEQDIQLDNMEVEVEEACLKTLALHQPVAIDLRFIIAVLKINNDLERVGDLAVNIAERAIFVSHLPVIDIGFDYTVMATKVQAMLKQALDALVNFDAGSARRVCALDDEIDALNLEMYGLVQDAVKRRPEHAETLIHMLSAVRHLERIADHATNIAEDVIYMTEGRIIRHKAGQYP